MCRESLSVVRVPGMERGIGKDKPPPLAPYLGHAGSRGDFSEGEGDAKAEMTWVPLRVPHAALPSHPKHAAQSCMIQEAGETELDPDILSCRSGLS